MPLHSSPLRSCRQRPRLGPVWAALVVFWALWASDRDAAAREIVHEVSRGHTLGAIAKRYRTTVEAIERINQLEPGQHIRPGQKLRISVADGAGRRSSTSRSKVSRRGHPRKRQGPAKHGLSFAEAAAAADGDLEKIHWVRSKVARSQPKSSGRKRTASSKPPSLVESYARRPPHPGHVTLIRFSERFSGQLVDSRGRVLPKAHARVSRLLRDLRTRQVVPINRRLLSMLAELSDHFGGRPIVVVSGFRMYSHRQHTADSRHNYGQAIDFRIAGVPNEAVRDYCLGWPAVGVGYYPRSSFIHLDARSNKATWVDSSGPGQKPRYVRKRQRVAQSAKPRKAGGGRADHRRSARAGSPAGRAQTASKERKAPVAGSSRPGTGRRGSKPGTGR